jgi:branched-chain amino acid transport system ATP-binding protein
VRRGVIQVMEGRHCFGHLSIEENLLTGAYTRSQSRAELKESLEKVYAYFPRLKTRRTSQAGYTSGGEQQMCAIGRALMAKPEMILLDEPSMGLAPQIVEEIFEIVKDLNSKENVSFLLAEQNTMVALRYADFGYILENGRVVMEGEAADLRTNEDVKEFYLGLSSEGRKSFREVKHYRRRKRWLSWGGRWLRLESACLCSAPAPPNPQPTNRTAARTKHQKQVLRRHHEILRRP